MAEIGEDVVIAGAGPNGLMLACELALAGVRPVVLDGQPGPGAEPKANGLAGQVIRILDMRGLYQVFGGPDGPPEPLARVDVRRHALRLSGVEDNPMHAQMIQQPRVVRLLEKRARNLGVDVRWGHAVVGLVQGEGGVTVSVGWAGRAYDLSADLPGRRRRRSQPGPQDHRHRISRQHLGLGHPTGRRASARRTARRRRRLRDPRFWTAAVPAQPVGAAAATSSFKSRLVERCSRRSSRDGWRPARRR